MKLKPEDIDSIVAKIAGLTVHTLHSSSQKQKVTEARNLAMLKCQEYLKYSSLKLQRHYGKDSHTTILSDLKSARNLIETDPLARVRTVDVDVLIQHRIQEFLMLKQRYNLHYRIRQKGLRLDMKSKTVSIHPDRRSELEKGQLMKLLTRHGYGVQYAFL